MPELDAAASGDGAVGFAPDRVRIRRHWLAIGIAAAVGLVSGAALTFVAPSVWTEQWLGVAFTVGWMLMVASVTSMVLSLVWLGDAPYGLPQDRAEARPIVQAIRSAAPQRLDDAQLQLAVRHSTGRRHLLALGAVNTLGPAAALAFSVLMGDWPQSVVVWTVAAVSTLVAAAVVFVAIAARRFTRFLAAASRADRAAHAGAGG